MGWHRGFRGWLASYSNHGLRHELEFHAEDGLLWVEADTWYRQSCRIARAALKPIWLTKAGLFWVVEQGGSSRHKTISWWSCAETVWQDEKSGWPYATGHSWARNNRCQEPLQYPCVEIIAAVVENWASRIGVVAYVVLHSEVDRYSGHDRGNQARVLALYAHPEARLNGVVGQECRVHEWGYDHALTYRF